jgi:DNA-binding transcriptional regulator/RsmH inhibitor MraZ
MRGRPPSWNPFTQLDRETWVEVAQVDDKRRLSLPVAARRRLSWLNPDQGSALLADLGAAGYAELSPWEPFGAARVSEVSDLAARSGAADRRKLILGAMDRFLQVSLENGSRIHLAANLRAHLDPEGAGLVRVIVRENRLWLWSERGWQESRPNRLRAIDAAIAPAEAPAG